jgi:nitrite reductase (NADH) large subunit
MRPEPVPVWICSVCGYIHEGLEPPEECPACGAPREAFELEVQPIPGKMAASQTVRVVVVGGGIAGVSAAEALRRASPGAEILLISKDPDIPYYRMNLTRYLAGEIGRGQLLLHPESWYGDQRIQLLCGVEVTNIDTGQKEVVCKDGRRVTYDRLILANGANPFIPPVPGNGLKNVLTLRTLRDADALLAALKTDSHFLFIGGGLLGLETAGALACRGAKVTLLEDQAWLLPRQLNKSAAVLLEAYIASLGIDLRTGARTAELEAGGPGGPGAVCGVRLQSGEFIPADVVIFSTGVRSDTALARQAGLEVHLGVVVDDSMLTSAADVFAAGDLVEHRGALYGLWAPAQMQGTVAGTKASGSDDVSFAGVPRATTLKVLGYGLFNIGRTAPTAPEDVEIQAQSGRNYAWFLFQGGKMTGAILLGDTTHSTRVKQVVESGQDFSALLETHPGVGDILHAVEHT